MLVDHTSLNWALIWAAVAFLRSLTPISFIYIIIVLILLPSDLQPSKYASLYFLSEAVFYTFVFLPRKFYLQLPVVQPPPLQSDDRMAIFLRTIKSCSDPDKFLMTWFQGAPVSEIKQENFKQFYTWLFLNASELTDQDEDEVEEAMLALEYEMGRKFLPGLGEAKCIRLGIDPVPMLHRPLFYYLGLTMIDIITHISFVVRGFQYYRSSLSNCVSVFPTRPQTFITRYKSTGKTLSYWYRPHTSPTHLPVLFLHGVGIGFAPYVKLLSSLKAVDGDVGIIAIELHSISGRMASPPLNPNELFWEIQKILAHHNIDDFSLVSHSFGSVLTSQLLRFAPLSSRIPSIILLDPLTILITFPDALYNFARRPPTRANELQLYYFASQDMNISHTISRHLFWSESVAWKEDLLYRAPRIRGGDLEPRTLTVVLSGRDLIVDTKKVSAYLTSASFPNLDNENGQWYRKMMGNPSANSAWNSSDGDLRVLWLGNLDHSQMLTLSKPNQLVVREIMARTSIKGGEVDDGDWVY